MGRFPLLLVLWCIYSGGHSGKIAEQNFEWSFLLSIQLGKIIHMWWMVISVNFAMKQMMTHISYLDALSTTNTNSFFMREET